MKVWRNVLNVFGIANYPLDKIAKGTNKMIVLFNKYTVLLESKPALSFPLIILLFVM